MRTPTCRRLLVVLLSVAAATLGCARANTAFAPVTPDNATRQPPTATSTAIPPMPTATVLSLSPEPVTATPETPPTPAPAGEISPTPTTGEPVQPSADTPVPPTEAPAVPPSQVAVTAPPPATVPPPTIAPQAIQSVAIPPGATFTQQMAVTGQGGEMIGDPGYLIDNRTVTWAALDGGHTAWLFDLGSIQKIGGVKVYAQQPRGGEATTLLAIEVSNDGQSWQPVLVGKGECGEPRCDAIPQMTFTEIGFNPVSARYLRLRSGPNRFGFAEVALAIVP